MWNVIGQPKALELLRHSLAINRLAHAYLFVGRQHVGKTTLAVCVAQALNCQQGIEPCGQCSSCLRIAAGKHPDVQFIRRLPDDGQGLKRDIGIAQIKELQQYASLQPYEGRHRVFIIDSAENLNEESANCLLKTLEEPSPNVLFILLASSDGGLLPTIVSRCQRIELYPVPAQSVEQALREHYKVPPDKAKVLGSLCRGAIGWAVSAAEDDKLLQERYQRLDELRGLSSEGLNQRFAFASKLASRFSKNREFVEETLNLWAGWWRDILLIKAGCARFITNIGHEEILRQQAGEYSLSAIKGFIEAVLAASRQLEQNANALLVLEVLMLNIPGRDRKGDETREREEVLR